MESLKTFHIQLERNDSDQVTITGFTADHYESKERSCKLEEIADLLQDAERDYYTMLPAERTENGKKLYKWLDGDERWLSISLGKPSLRNHTILAIETGDQNGDLAHLPWELLHDDKGFLVERNVVPVRWLSGVESELEEPKARSLRVLFMATAPDGVEPVLNFELEEQEILKTAEAQPLSLVVEESGSLTGLRRVAASKREEHFDVLHLSGHAKLTEKGARFLTETETGKLQEVSADEITEALDNRAPQLIFLSGCNTGRATGAARSMAEELLHSGGNAVLGWGRAVFDDSAIKASAVLYSKLSKGDPLIQAIASTYKHLIKEKVDDWHLLRLYAPGESTVAVPGAFVTSDGEEREQAIYKPTTEELTERFADEEIVSPLAFVGRRREIQRCRRSLKSASDAGSLIYGLGGIGKTALAARLCYGLSSEYQYIAVPGKIDESKLVKALLPSVEGSELYDLLKSKQSLTFRLKKVFSALQKSRSRKLIVLDKFEANLEPRDGKFVLSAAARGVLEALVDAIRNPDAGMRIEHRLIITSRYRFSFEHLSEQPLAALQPADLMKKFNSLNLQLNGTLRSEVLRLSDGNPRLLKVLDKRLSTTEQEQELEQFKTDRRELLKLTIGEKFIAQVDQLDAHLRQLLATGLLFTLAIPQSMLIKLSSSTDADIDRAIALGVLEVNVYGDLRVPRLLSIDPINNPETSAQAAQTLDKFWNLDAIRTTLELDAIRTTLEKETEARMLEVHRLAQQGNASGLALEVAQTLVKTYLHCSRFRDAIELCKSTLSVTQDYRILHRLGQCEKQIGQFEQAETHYQQALALCPLEDEQKRAFLLYELAVLKVNQDQLEAELLFQQAEQLQEHLQNPTLQTAILHGWAALYDRKGDLQTAVDLCNQALNPQREVTDLDLREIYQRLGEIQLQRREFKEAEANLRRSLELKGIKGDVRGKSMALLELARLYYAQAQFEKAFEFYTYSLVLQESLENYLVQAAVWYQLAKIYQYQKQFKDAIECCEKALEIHTQFNVNDPDGEAAIIKLREDIQKKSNH